VLNEQGVWDLYVQSYDVTHTLGAKHITREINEILTAKGVI